MILWPVACIAHPLSLPSEDKNAQRVFRMLQTFIKNCNADGLMIFWGSTLEHDAQPKASFQDV